MRQKDLQTRLTNSILRNSRTIKFHGWEGAFLDRVLGIRGQELAFAVSSQRSGVEDLKPGCMSCCINTLSTSSCAVSLGGEKTHVRGEPSSS
ncbi:hypothetical protein P7K49_031905 [Saguinus oedipus]|uniref:Uncharacterized protein n=1 Tax=Saguinus oedipus TaxID=9490 RepID=A0ABQ9U0R0_SAGOE|nr:hypothetical protein P7K49_031905 [Saguinus oedipus]